ncbi:MAG: Ig-like domain-containing protein [Candidatus Woesearchaeota archaeon]
MNKKAIAKITGISFAVMLALGIIFYGVFVLATITSLTPNTPANNAFTNDTTPDFNFTVIGNETTTNCTLFINATARGTNASVLNNTPTILTANATLAQGVYTWYVNCTDPAATNSSVSRTLTVDTTAPTVVVTLNDSALKVGETALVTFTFSENVTGFNESDVTTPNGAMGAVTGNSLIYTGIFTPTANTTAATNVATVGTSWTDTALNAPVGTTNSANYAIDTLRPTVTSATLNYNDSNRQLVVTFSEIVDASSAVATAFHLNNATGTDSVTLSAAPTNVNATTLTFTLTEAQRVAALAISGVTGGDTVAVVLDVDPSGVADLAGNANLIDDNNTVTETADTNKPIISALTVSDASLIASDVAVGGFVVTINFSETMGTTGPTIAFNPVVSTTVTNCGGVWSDTDTFTYTCDVEDANVTQANVNISVSGAKDVATVTMLQDTTTGVNKFSIDTINPAISSADITTADGSYNASQNIDITVTYSEAVTITGSPRIELNVVGAGTRYATYNSGTGTANIVFRYTVQAGDNIGDLGASNLTIGLNGGTIKDAAGNDATNTLPNNLTAANAVVVDTTAPTVVLIGNHSDLVVRDADTVVFTATFTEANSINAVTVPTITIDGTGGGVCDVTAANLTNTSNLVWTYSWDVPAVCNGAAAVSITATDVAGNANTAATGNTSYTIDNTAPTVVLSDDHADSIVRDADTVVIQATFTETNQVSESTPPTITIGTLVVGGAMVKDSNTVWNYTWNVPSGNDSVVAVSITATDVAGNANTAATGQTSYTIDNTAPTVGVALNDTALKVGETALVTFTFSENVTGFNNSDLTIPNGGLTAVSSADGNVTWTATFTPTDDLEDASNVITVAMTTLTDFAGNAGVGTNDSSNFVIDTKEPTVNSATMNYNNNISQLVVTFSEIVDASTAVASKFHLNNVTTTDLVTLSAAPANVNATTLTFTLTEAQRVAALAKSGVTGGDGGAVVLDVDAGAVADMSSNTNLADDNNTVTETADTNKPTISSLTVSDASLIASDVAVGGFVVTINFSETMGTTGPTIAFNPVVSTTVTNCGGVWSDTDTFTYTCDVEDANVESANVNISVSGAKDVATVTMLQDTTTGVNKFSIDTIAPSIVVASNVSTLKKGETALVNFTLSEAATNFIVGDVTVAGGTLSSFTNVSSTFYTVVFTPTDNSVAAGTVNVSAATFTDAAGNANTVSNHVSMTVDTIAPSIVVASNVSTLKKGETALVNFTLSEAATNFIVGDVTVAGGTLSSFTNVSSTFYTVVFTPTDNSVAAGTVNVSAATFTDAAGNANTVSNHVSMTVDTLAPTVAITLNDPALKVGETALVTFTFTEAVTNFTNADVTTIDTGTLTAVASSNNITWTATFTPTVNATNTTNVITVTNTGLNDLAGNAGSGTNSSANYAVDTKRPTVGVALSDYALKIGDTPTLTLTFSEVVFNFNNSDITTIDNGALTAVASSDNITWTATFTPGVNVTDATNVITVDLTGLVDASGNAGEGTNSSANYAIDTKAPTVALTYSSNPAKAGAMNITATYSESVASTPSISIDQPGSTDITTQAMSGSGAVWTYNYTVVAASSPTYLDGTATVSLSAVNDAAGNAAGSPTTPTFVIDTTGPDFYFTNPTAGSTISSTFQLAVDTDGTAAGCEFKNATFTYGAGTAMTLSGTTSYTASLSGISTGNQTYYVICADTANNTVTRSRSFIVGTDTTAPAGLGITTADATVNSDYYTISGTLSVDANDVTIQILDASDATYGTVIIPAGQTAWSVVVSLPQSTATTYRAKAVDPSSNALLSTANADTALRNVTITENASTGADVTAPPVPVITTANATVNADTYSITGTAAADTPSDTLRTIIVYNGATQVASVSLPVGQTAWSVFVPLTQSSANVFTAKSFDVYGNVGSASASITITENASTGADVTAPPVPVITTANATVNADTYSITGTAAADTPSDTLRTIIVYNGATQVTSVSLPVGQTAWSVFVPLTQSSANVFTAKSFDVYGNVGSASASITITENAADVTAPTITASGPSGTDTDGAVTLTATTDENATCRYDTTDTSYASMTGNFTGAATVHTAALTLTNGNHQYYVRCTDGTNVMTSSSVIGFTVTIPADTTAPRVIASSPSGLINDSTPTLYVKLDSTDNVNTSSCKYSTSAFDFATQGTAMTWNGTGFAVTLSAQSDGTKMYYVLCADTANNLMGSAFPISYILDTTGLFNYVQSLNLNWNTLWLPPNLSSLNNDNTTWRAVLGKQAGDHGYDNHWQTSGANWDTVYHYDAVAGTWKVQYRSGAYAGTGTLSDLSISLENPFWILMTAADRFQLN